MIEIAAVGKPSQDQREAFKEAKQHHALTEPMMFVAARPGHPRVIVFGSDEDAMPDFACEWITLYRSDPADVRDALAWYMGFSEDWRAASMELWLERVTGRAGVKEVAHSATVG